MRLAAIASHSRARQGAAGRVPAALETRSTLPRLACRGTRAAGLGNGMTQHLRERAGDLGAQRAMLFDTARQRRILLDGGGDLGAQLSRRARRRRRPSGFRRRSSRRISVAGERRAPAREPAGECAHRNLQHFGRFLVRQASAHRRGGIKIERIKLNEVIWLTREESLPTARRTPDSCAGQRAETLAAQLHFAGEGQRECRRQCQCGCECEHSPAAVRRE